METDDDRHLYEVEQEYDNIGKDGFPHQPMTNLQIHDTISSTGKCFLYVLLGIQVVIILILIILLGINGVTLTHLNTVEVCDNTGGSTSGIVGGISDDTCAAQILNITRHILSYKDNNTMYTQRNTDLLQLLTSNTQGSNDLLQVLTSNITQVLRLLLDIQGDTNLLQVLANNMTQLSQQLGGTDAKVDGIRAAVDEHMVYTLNMSDVLNQVFETTGDSAQKLVNIVSSLTNLKDTGTTTAAVVDDILVIVEELLTLQNASSLFNSILPVSCKDIKAVLPNSPTGYYHVNSGTIYCNMDTLCSSTGGWTRLAYLDMTDSTQNCPSGFRLYQSGGVRACGRPGSSASCVSVQFPSNGISYSQICGRVTGYQYYSADAFQGQNSIDSYYVEGVSITHGSPRQHVWTLACGISDTHANYPQYICPCMTGSSQSVPSFVGSHYFCESGNHNSYWSPVLYTSDPLWDGQGCGALEGSCCAAPGLPWFHRDYGTNTTTDYIELRVCSDQGSSNEDAPVSLYEIYVK